MSRNLVKCRSLQSMVRHDDLPRYGSVSNLGSGSYNLAEAAFRGDTSRVQEIMEVMRNNFESVEMKSYNGHTPLMGAAFMGHLEIVRILVLHNAALESRDRDGDTALAYAVRGNRPKIVWYLLDEGSDINTSNEKGMTPIHTAICEGHWSCAENILTHRSGCNINCRTGDGHTPLFFAIEKNEPRVIKRLVQHPDVDIEMADARGFNSLHHAAMQNSQSTVEMILKKAPHMLNIQKDDGFTALHIAACNGFLDIVLTLAKRVSCRRDLTSVAGNTALHLAITSECHIKCIKALVNYGADVNAQDADGDTSLHLVMMQATMQDGPINFVDIALYFIENHSDIYIKNNDGKNVLDVTINPTTRKIMKKAYQKKTKNCKVG